MECRNCNSEVSDHYCSNCGTPAVLPRINLKYILDEIGSVLSFKKGILYTIKVLLLTPGPSIKEFILTDRKRLVKPVIFLVFSSFIYTILHTVLGFEDGYINYRGDSAESASAAITGWLNSNYGYANILIALFVTIWVKIFFQKHSYNFFELLILLLFVFGMSMMIYSVFGILETVTSLKVMFIGGIIGIMYSSWAIGQFFDGKKVVNYILGVLSYVLGFLSFIACSIGVGLLIDMIKV